MTPIETGILTVVAVAVIAWVMKAMSGDSSGGSASSPQGSDPSVEELLEEASAGATENVVIASDGWGFVPRGQDVLLFPPREHDDTIALSKEVGENSLRNLLATRPEYTLEPGDLIAARVVRGAPGFDPWRLEGLGRDREYRAWFFETDEAARAALDLLQSRTVRPALGEDGEPEVVPESEFEEARLRDEETERALDHPDE